MTTGSGALSEADALFIEGVRQTCILYNPSSADFRLSYKKEKAWEDLAANLGITPTDARRRWTCLRDRYTRELRHIRMKSPRKGDCGGSELFRQMDFLRPFVKKRVIHPNPWKAKAVNANAKNKLQADNTDNDIQSYCENTEDQYDNKLGSTSAEEEYNLVACELDPLESYEEYTTEQQNFTTEASTVPGSQQKCLKNDVIPIMLSPMPASANMVNNANQQHQDQIKFDSKLLGTTQQQQETEDDFFCKSVAMYLRKLSRRHKIKAKVEMFQILEKYIEIEENTAAAIDQRRRDDHHH